MDKKLIRNNIKKVRDTYGLTQKQLAEKIAYARSTIGQVEKGHCNPTEHLLNSISLVLKINKKWLITGKGPMKKSNKEILEEAIDLIDGLTDVEIAFLEIMKAKFENEDKEKANFYQLLLSLMETYQKSDRDTQGYIIVQLKKLFNEYIEK